MDKPLTYAGIGSRETPPKALADMDYIAAELAAKGWRLRSGGARGADSAFGGGAPLDHQEIWIPTPGSNGHRAGDPGVRLLDRETAARAETLAADAHGAWDRCSDWARKAHTRNVAIVLGGDLDDPAAAVVCWTPGGEARGGTGVGIRLAEAAGVPVFNLHDVTRDDVLAKMDEIALARAEGREPDLGRDVDPEAPAAWAGVADDRGVDVLSGEDGQGYDKDGQMGPVKAGDPKRDEHGHALQDTYEGQTTYRAYHASDLNIDKMPEDRPPMSGEWADKYVAAKMEERAEAAGEPVREATAEERTAILIERQLEKRCDMAELHGVQFETAERDDYSFGVNAEGTPVIQVPASDNPDVSLDQSYTSLAIACSHAEQHRSATDALARDAAPDGDINLSDERRGELERLVEAYSLPEAERATNADFSRAELVATYSAVTEVTGHGGQYEAPESTRSEFNREQWAKELSQPGGFERVSRDINRAEEALAERMPRTQASPEQVRSGSSSGPRTRRAASTT